MSSEETPRSDIAVTDRRSGADGRRNDRRKKAIPVALDRRKGKERRQQGERRRQIDPTTCERDYSGDEIEFMQAMDAYKRTSGRMFPTCSEILEVIRAMGYVRLTPGSGATSTEAPSLPADEANS